MTREIIGTPLDYGVIAFYFIGILIFGSYFARYTKTTHEFFFAGQRFAWWLVAFSFIATTVGSYSFIKYSEAAFTYGEKNWRVPDPDILRFIHLARPLADLEPDYVYPGSDETLAEIAEKLPINGIARRDDVWTGLPFLLRIGVDFNSLSTDGTMVRINTVVFKHLLEILHPGLRVILYASHDLEVEAMIHCEEDKRGQNWWYGIPDWDTMRDL